MQKRGAGRAEARHAALADKSQTFEQADRGLVPFHRAALGAGEPFGQQRRPRFAHAPAHDAKGNLRPVICRHQRGGERLRRQAVEGHDRGGLALVSEDTCEDGRAREGRGRRVGVDAQFGELRRIACAEAGHDRLGGFEHVFPLRAENPRLLPVEGVAAITGFRGALP